MSDFFPTLMKPTKSVFPFVLLGVFVMAGLTGRAEVAASRPAEDSMAKLTKLTVKEFWRKTDQERALLVSEATYALIGALQAERNAQGVLKPAPTLAADRNLAGFIRDSLTMRIEETTHRLPYLGAELVELTSNVAKVIPDTNFLQVLLSFSAQKYKAYLGSTAGSVDVSPIPRPQEVQRFDEIQNDARSGKITPDEAKVRIEKINSDQWDYWAGMAINFPDGIKAIRNRNGVWYRIEGSRTRCSLVRWD